MAMQTMAGLSGPKLFVHNRSKESVGAVLGERAACVAELARAIRAIDTMTEVALPFFPGSTRSASNVRDARSGSGNRTGPVVSQLAAAGGNPSSRSASAGGGGGAENHAPSVSNGSAGFDPRQRCDAVKACAHELREVLAAVAQPPPSQLPLRAAAVPGNVGSMKDIPSRLTTLRTNPDFDDCLQARRQQRATTAHHADPNAADPAQAAIAPAHFTFRPLHPAWTREQLAKHRRAKTSAAAPPSAYHVGESGVVESASFVQPDITRRALLQEKHRDHSLYVLRFARTAVGQSADEQRKKLFAGAAARHVKPKAAAAAARGGQAPAVDAVAESVADSK